MDNVEIASTIRHAGLSSVMQDVGEVDPRGEVILVAEPQSNANAVQARRVVLARKRLIPVGHTGVIKADESQPTIGQSDQLRPVRRIDFEVGAFVPASH